jgi:hypothetical protein
MLPGEADVATKFLQSKLLTGIEVQGQTVKIDNEKANEVKLLLKKFLHRCLGLAVVSRLGRSEVRRRR